MKEKEFNELLDNRISKIHQVLVVKAKEYANDDDRLHNFNKASKMSNQSRERALLGFLLKHQVSLDDIVEKLDQGILPSRELLDEKMGDIINYYILVEACIVDKINKKSPISMLKHEGVAIGNSSINFVKEE